MYSIMLHWYVNKILKKVIYNCINPFPAITCVNPVIKSYHKLKTNKSTDMKVQYNAI